MPADIRSFFAPRGGGSEGTPSEERPKPKPTPGAARKTAARKRRVIDSDDEESDPPPKKVAMKKATPKAKQAEEIIVEASSYFSSTGKNKVNRVVPVRAPKLVNFQSKKEENYLDGDDDETDDIFAEAFQKKEDEYKEEPQDEDMDDFIASDNEDVKPNKRTSKISTTTTSSKKRRSLASDDEEQEKDTPKKIPAKKPPAKRVRAPAKAKEESTEDSEVQKLHDAIPTVRAPTPPPREEGRKFNFRDAIQRAGPVSQGTKDIPTGADNCLAGLTFVFTGVQESLSREDGQQLVKRYGGKVTTAPSKKTSYVVLGSDAGPKKLESIRTLKIKTIDEDGLFQLIRTLPPNGGDGKAAKDWEAKKLAEEKKIRDIAAEMEKTAKANTQASKAKGVPSKDSGELWTVKYAPNKITEICGNKAQVEKLQKWLKNWPKSLRTEFKLKGSDGTGGYRAVMIHGAPGIGKTTAAHMVANLEGYDVLEYNASDTRSKKLMEDTMRDVLDNRSLMGYFASKKEKVDIQKKKLVLIMDEVDGMSAGDRGGVGQLAAFCKKTSVPIICICNERKLPKMKPFDPVTLDIAFRRPDTNAIRSRIASIAFREGLTLPANVIDQLVEGTRADIRQIINMLSTYKTTATKMNFDESKNLAKSWEKHIVLKPWDIAQKLLGTEMFGMTSKKTLNDKMELYFNDHEFSYLMIQENYLKMRPDRANRYSGKERDLKILELADNAAMSISDGDLVDSMIHGQQQHWSLMPVHGMFSTIIPSSYTYGSFGGGHMMFTSWLGMNSKQGKLSRFVKEIQSHIRLRSSGDRHEVRQSYIPSFFNMLVRRLEVEGKDAVPDIIEIMDDYFLTKDDWDAIIELGVGPMAESTVNIPSQTRGAFTKTYNQMSHPMPFMKSSSVTTKAAKKEVPDNEEAIIESEDETAGAAEMERAEADEADITKDKYVKQPKKKATSKGKEKAVTREAKAAKAINAKAGTTKTTKTAAKRGRGKGAA